MRYRGWQKWNNHSSCKANRPNPWVCPTLGSAPCQEQQRSRAQLRPDRRGTAGLGRAAVRGSGIGDGAAPPRPRLSWAGDCFGTTAEESTAPREMPDQISPVSLLLPGTQVASFLLWYDFKCILLLVTLSSSGCRAPACPPSLTWAAALPLIVSLLNGCQCPEKHSNRNVSHLSHQQWETQDSNRETPESYTNTSSCSSPQNIFFFSS